MGDETIHDRSALELLVELLSRAAGKMDAQTRRLAKFLFDLNIIDTLYNGLDSLSLSSSLFIYATDIYLNDPKLSTSDAMHDWMMTPAGLLVAATTSVSLIAFSMLASRFSDEDSNAFKRYVAILWPYVRDTIKATKNAYKGWRAVVQVGAALSGQNLNLLIVPIGVLLGGVSVLNRIWYRHMTEQRKVMMKANATLLKLVKKAKSLQELEAFHKAEKQTVEKRALALLSAGLGGFIDGLYLYVGILGVSALAPPVLVALATFTAAYVLLCVATRMYDEYDFQRKLVATQLKVDLAFSGKRIELYFARLQELSQALSTDPENYQLSDEQDDFIKLFEQEVNTFKEKHEELRSLNAFKFTSAFLHGARNGLAAYGALASLIFGVTTILVLTSTSFPPALLIAAVSMGMVLLGMFIAHSLISAYWQHEKKVKEQKVNLANDKLAKIEQLLEDTKTKISDLKPDVVLSTIQDGMVVDDAPQMPFQEWFEVIRSFFSGIRKGTKAISLTFYPLEQADEMGHYHETPVMLVLMVASAGVHALVLALRAFTRAFGRPPIDEVPDPVEAVENNNVPGEPEEGLIINPDNNNDDPGNGGAAEPVFPKKSSPNFPRATSCPSFPSYKSGSSLVFFRPASPMQSDPYDLSLPNENDDPDSNCESRFIPNVYTIQGLV